MNRVISKGILFSLFVLKSFVSYGDLRPVFLSLKLVPDKNTYYEGDKISFTLVITNGDKKPHPVLPPDYSAYLKKICYFRVWHVASYYIPVTEESREIPTPLLQVDEEFLQPILLQPGDSIWFRAHLNAPRNLHSALSDHRFGTALFSGTYYFQAFYNPQGTSALDSLYEFDNGFKEEFSPRKTLLSSGGIISMPVVLKILPAPGNDFTFEDLDYKIISDTSPADRSMITRNYYVTLKNYPETKKVHSAFYNGDFKFIETHNYYREQGIGRTFTYTISHLPYYKASASEFDSYYAKSFTFFLPSGAVKEHYQLEPDKCPVKRFEVQFRDDPNELPSYLALPAGDSLLFVYHYDAGRKLNYMARFGVLKDTAILEFANPYTSEIARTEKWKYSCEGINLKMEPTATKEPEKHYRKTDTVIDGIRYRFTGRAPRIVANQEGWIEFGDTLINDIKEGNWITTDVLKRTILKEKYINGISTGTAVEYYHTNFDYSYRHEGVLLNGRKIGEWHGYSRKNKNSKKWMLSTTQIYDHASRLVSQKGYYENGAVAYIQYYFDGLNGENKWQKSFNRKGELIYEGKPLMNAELL